MPRNPAAAIPRPCRRNRPGLSRSAMTTAGNRPTATMLQRKNAIVNGGTVPATPRARIMLETWAVATNRNANRPTASRRPSVVLSDVSLIAIPPAFPVSINLHEDRNALARKPSALFYRRTWQHRLACFHFVEVIERVPGRTGIALGRMRLVMAHEIADQRLGHAELDVAVDVWIGGIVDLRSQDLESLFEDQRVEMRRPIGMPVLRLQQPPDHAVGRDRITDH